jgi:peptidyl-prolyl cis-trans isomerase D
MLKQLRRFERTSKILILGFVGLMAVSLVLFFRPNSGSNQVEPTKSTEVLATVAGADVTVGDLAQLRAQYMQMLGGQMSLAQLGGDQRLLDGLIRDRVVTAEAARLSLAASEAEVSERIYKQYTDPSSGKFLFTDASGRPDFQKYKDSVTATRGDWQKFEHSVADSIAREKLEAYVTASVRVSEDEVREDYKRKNTTFDLTYVVVSIDKLAEKIQPTDAELKAYYEQHKNEYQFKLPQKKIRYLFIDQDKSGEKLQISDKDLHDEYDGLEPKFKEAGVNVQQIVLKIARPELDATVNQKATELVGKARGASGTATEDAFGELAKGNSEDPTTAKNGGRVTGVVKKDPTKLDDPYQKVLELQPGDVTDPIKYKNAYYILRRGASVPKTFDVAKPELLVSLRNRRGYTLAQKIAQKAQDRLKETKDPQKVAQELAAEANMKPADMVRETPFVKPNDDVPNIGSSQQFEDAIAPLNNPNDIGERVGIKNGFAIPMLIEKRDPRIPDLDEVKDKVTSALKAERAKAQLEDKARELIASAKAPGDLKAAAAKLGIEAKAEANYKLETPLGDSGSSVLLDDPLFTSKAGEVIQKPVLLNGNYIVLGVNKRTEADLAEFAKQRDTLMKSALDARKSQVFEDYLGATQKAMESSGKIKIYKEVLANMQDAEEPDVAPKPRPRLPTTR